MIDHRDRNRQNNAVWNLRSVNSSENQWNRGGKGVKKLSTSWKAKIRVNNKEIYKNFKTEEEASHAYHEAKLKYHNVGMMETIELNLNTFLESNVIDDCLH